MKRQETLSVWSPQEDDAIFIVDCDGYQRESITTVEDSEEKHIGSRPTGSRVTFEYNFPNADSQAKTVLKELLTDAKLEHSPEKMNGIYTVFDLEYDSAFDIGCETNSKIVLHAKRNTTPETIYKIYTTLTAEIDAPIQLIRHRYEI